LLEFCRQPIPSLQCRLNPLAGYMT